MHPVRSSCLVALFAGAFGCSDAADERVTMVTDTGAAETVACAADNECGASEVCAFTAQSCGGDGVCTLASDCIGDAALRPYCACDRTVFYDGTVCPTRPHLFAVDSTNLCEGIASDAGLSPPDAGSAADVGARDGSASDAGFLCFDNSNCPGPSICAFEEMSCGRAGRCKAVTQCIGDASIISYCGCDGMTFDEGPACPSRPFTHALSPSNPTCDAPDASAPTADSGTRIDSGPPAADAGATYTQCGPMVTCTRAAEICVETYVRTGPIYSCIPLPTSCPPGQRDCACAGQVACPSLPFVCRDTQTDNVLACDCPNC